MPAPAYPAVLTSTAWDKIKGSGDKPTGVGDALKLLKKAHDAIDADLLDLPKGADAAGLAQRLAAIDAQLKGAVKALGDQQGKLALLVRKWEPELKKAGAPAKAAAAGIAEVGDAAQALLADWTAALQAARTAAAAQAQKLAAAAPAKADAKADPLKETPQFRTVRGKVLESLRAVRAGAGGPDAPEIHFLACTTAKGCMVYMARSVSASHKALLQALLPGEGSFKFHLGRCIWEKKTWTFVGDDVPAGLARRLQPALKYLTGSKFAVRVRRPDGEAEEAEGDADALLALADDATGTAAATPVPAPAPAAAGPAEATDTRAFAARAAEVAAALAAAIKAGHPKAGALKAKLAEAVALATTPARVAAAARAVELIAKALQAAPAPAPGGSAAAADDGAWKRAQARWQQHVEVVDAQLAAVRGRMLALGTEDMKRIADRGLPALTNNHKTPVMRALLEVAAAQGEARTAALGRAAAAVAAFRSHLQSDPMIRVLDDNAATAFGVPLTIRSEIGAGLDAVQSAIDALSA